MNKLSLKSRSEITYLPNKELRIEINPSPNKNLKDAIKRNWYFYFERFGLYVIFPIYFGIAILGTEGYIDNKYILWFQPIFLLFYFPFMLNRYKYSPKPESITFTTNTMELAFPRTKKIKEEMRIGYESLYFEVTILPNLVELRIEGYTIPLEDVADFPLVIDHISELWDFEYYDTFHTPRNSEILIYKPKSAARFEPSSFLLFEEKPPKIKVLDKMNLSNWFEIDTNIDEIECSKFSKIRFHLGKIKRIDITIKSKNRFSTKSALNIIIIYENDESRYIFESDKRLEKDELTVLRDMERIYEKLKEIDALKNVKIVKTII
jgi:hypothetical protein